MSILDLVPFGHNRRSAPPAPVDEDPVRALQTDVDRAFETFWNMVAFPLRSDAPATVIASGLGEMKVDVSDNGKEVTIAAELPGVTEDMVDISLGEDGLTIRAERESQQERNDDGVIVRERTYGMLQRTITLPDGVETDAAAARLKNGVLTIVIPKSAAAQLQRQKIKVKAD